jgi:HAD superfamily hydrolase (TIGR01509 family)
VPADPPRALLLDVGKVILDITAPAVDVFSAATNKNARDFEDEFAFFRAVADVAVDLMFDQDAVALMRDARAAGRRVGVLSNDAYFVMGREFFATRPEFAGLDAFVDALDLGVRKPAPAAYQRAAEALGTPPEQIVFLDDTPECVEGGRAAGMHAIQVDPADRRPAFAAARHALGVPG